MADALNRAEQAEQTAKARVRELNAEKVAFAQAREELMAEARDLEKEIMGNLFENTLVKS